METFKDRNHEALAWTMDKLTDLENRITLLENNNKDLKVIYGNLIQHRELSRKTTDDNMMQGKRDVEIGKELIILDRNMNNAKSPIIPPIITPTSGWWNNKIKLGDIIYVKSLNKFGIFMGPSFKQGSLRIRLIKDGSKQDVYTRNRILPENDVELVKSNKTIKDEFIENTNSYSTASLKQKEQFKINDIIYYKNLNKFGKIIDILKGRKALAQFFKDGNKYDTAGTQYKIKFSNIKLVKRGEHVRRGFVETEKRYRLKGDI